MPNPTSTVIMFMECFVLMLVFSFVIYELVDDNPIEEVRLTVPITDDPTESALTFRTWVLGLISCCILSFVNQFFNYRQNQISISSISVQIVVLPIGKLMAATLPETKIRLPFTKWSFSLNPGRFTMKEHVLITIFANCGAGSVYAVNIITIVKAFYHRTLHPVAAMLLAQTTQVSLHEFTSIVQCQMIHGNNDTEKYLVFSSLYQIQLLGYGWAGIFRKFLVDSPYMWWPANLVQVSLFRYFTPFFFSIIQKK